MTSTADRATIAACMMSARCLQVPPIAWILIAPLTMRAVGQEPQVGTPDPGPPTAIEQALIERRCSATFTDAHQVCLSSQLNSLRADFGHDLNRLSGAERRALDSACNRIRTEQGREGYLDCLGAQLVALRNRRGPRPAATDAPALPRPPMSVPSAKPTPRAGPMSSVSGVWTGVALVTLFVAAGGALLAVKARRAAPRKCRVCGGDAQAAGDLCQKCHEAAEASRRAAAERADQKRAQQEELRRRREEEEEQRRRKARQAEEARLQQQEEARQREENARQREREEEDARRRSQAAVVSEEAFDPYAVLGVSKDASKEAIGMAYLEARSKYDLDHVSHLGVELQEHYKARARAVDRAYQMLTK